MGLIARVLEAAGIPTLCMSSARDITEAVLPPRAVFLHYPLGHQAGKPLDPANQLAVTRAALEAGVAVEEPGSIVDLPFAWDVPGDEGWERTAYTPESVTVGPDGKPNRDG